MRPSGRAPDQMRTIVMEPGFTRHAEGSCLVSFGDTRVLCTASVEGSLPPGQRQGRAGYGRNRNAPREAPPPRGGEGAGGKKSVRPRKSSA